MQESRKKKMGRLRKYLIVSLCVAGVLFSMFYVMLVDPLFLFNNNIKDTNKEFLVVEEPDKENIQSEEIVDTQEKDPSLLEESIAEQVPVHGEYEVNEGYIEYPVEEIYANTRVLAHWTLEEYKNPLVQAQGYFPIKAFVEKMRTLSLSSQENIGGERTVPTMEVLRLINEYFPIYIDSIILDNSGSITQKEKIPLLTSLEHTVIQARLILHELTNSSPNMMIRLTELAHRKSVLSTLEKDLERIDGIISNLIKVGKNEDLSSLAEKKHELIKRIRAEKQNETENEDLLSFLYTTEAMEAFPMPMVKEIVAVIIEYTPSSSPQPFIHTLQNMLLNMKELIERKKKDISSLGTI
ncbi:MAG: vWA domain-containing protein [Desulfovibrionaceae bacterium]